MPVWSSDGRELFYVNGDVMMVAEVAAGPRLTLGAPRPLFTGQYFISVFSVSPDGQRFLTVQENEPEEKSS